VLIVHVGLLNLSSAVRKSKWSKILLVSRVGALTVLQTPLAGLRGRKGERKRRGADESRGEGRGEEGWKTGRSGVKEGRKGQKRGGEEGTGGKGQVCPPASRSARMSVLVFHGYDPHKIRTSVAHVMDMDWTVSSQT